MVPPPSHIHTPTLTHNVPPKVKADFVQPNCYIRYREPKENSGAITGFKDLHTADPVEYDLSLEDMNWLRAHHKYGENGDPRFRISETLFERMLYLLELHCGKEDRIITVKEAENIFVERLKLYRPSAAERKHISPHNMHTSNAVSIVYKYWMDRRNKLQKPLLRRFWAPTSIENQNPHMVFRPREKERYRLRKNRRNDADALIKSQHMLDNLEKAKRILTYVRKRELVKRHLLTIRREAFLQKLSVIIDPPENRRPSKLEELTADLNYILSGKSTDEDVDAEVLDTDENSTTVSSSTLASTSSDGGASASGLEEAGAKRGTKRSLSDADMSRVTQGSLKQVRMNGDLNMPLSWGSSVGMGYKSHQSYFGGGRNGRAGAGRPYVRYAEQVQRMRGMAGNLLRHISQSERHAVAAAVFGLGEFMSDNEASQVAVHSAQFDRRGRGGSGDSTGGESSIGPLPLTAHSAYSATPVSNSASSSSINSTSTTSVLASGMDAEGRLHVSGSEAGGMVSPMKKTRSTSILSHQKKMTETLGFARTADDKIVCDRLQDMPGFVPSFLLDVEHPEVSPAVRWAMNEWTLPGRVGPTSSAVDASLETEQSLIAVQQQLLRHHRPPVARVLPTYPPQRWAVTDASTPKFGRAECKTGENRRFLLNKMAVLRVAQKQTTKKTKMSMIHGIRGPGGGGGSRGLWRRKKPPVRYFARGRIGRNNRIWMDRSVALDLSRSEDGCDLDSGDALSDSSTHWRGALGHRDHKPRNRLMDHELTYGFVKGGGMGGPPPVVPDVHSGLSVWSSRQRSSLMDDKYNDIAPGSSAGGRKHVYAAPHPLDSGNKFFDIAGSVAEQVPGMVSSMKHLNPKTYLACEEIVSTQPIISAASSAAGTAKSTWNLFFRFFTLMSVV